MAKSTKKKEDSPKKITRKIRKRTTFKGSSTPKISEIKTGQFRFQAVPSETKSELMTNESYKRFHGARMRFSWLPDGLIQNTKDRFGYMFKRLLRSRLPYNAANVDLLKSLGEEMGRTDIPSIGDSIIPAGYTYLGQFIDHDITLDINSDINKLQNAEKIPNMRTPALDLDSIYGQGPGLNPFLYDHTPGPGSGVLLLLGRNTNTGPGGPALRSDNNNFGNPATIAGGNNFDVQRTSDFTAIIGDPRNDENLIVSQIQHLFIKFHNKIVKKLIADGLAGDLFTEAKRIATRHYQWVVIHDFLKRVADPAIVNSTLRTGPRHFKGRDFFMPVEFSVAAYRFGHSMIRNDYFVNAPLTGQLGNRPATLKQVFEFIRVPLLPLTSNWVVDFNLFFNGRSVPTVNGVKFNNARKIDTRLAAGLGELPGESTPFMKMLAQRNLVRGLALGLPSGQAVARALRVTPLTTAELEQNNTPQMNTILRSTNGKLLTKTPLWFYILKEAEIKASGNRLGSVGSCILAETFVRMLKEDSNSFLNASPRFSPVLPRFNSRPVGDFDMTDIINFAGLLSLD